MCTLSWWVSREGRGVLFNRDEKRTRSRGLPPRLHREAGGELQSLLPLDPDAASRRAGDAQVPVRVARLRNARERQGVDLAPQS